MVSALTSSTPKPSKQGQSPSPAAKAYETEIQPDPDYRTEVICAFAAQMSQMSSNLQDILQVHCSRSTQSQSRPPPSTYSNSSSKPTKASLSKAHCSHTV